MVWELFSSSGRRARLRAADAAHRAVLAGARRPSFYRAGVATDDFDGRFDMAALHAVLVLRRLRTCGQDGRAAAEALQRAVFSGFDHALREEGVGDARIAKRMRALGERFYGLARAIDAALENGDLKTALGRNGLGGGEPEALARHVETAVAALDRTADADMLAGRFDWPDFPGADRDESA